MAPSDSISTRRLRLDETGRLLGLTGEDGREIRFDYAPDLRRLRITGADGRTQELAWEREGTVAAAHDPATGQRVFHIAPAQNGTGSTYPVRPRAPARPRSGPAVVPAGLVSVIVPCFNELGCTRECLDALARHTRGPWELIVIDNGSTDGTADFLAGLASLYPVPMTVIANATNRGFPAACNQGLKAARGAYLVLVNNDTVPTDSWDAQLAALANSDPRIGLTGPVSNYASPPQLIEHVPYNPMDGMHRFAADWRRQYLGKWAEVGKLSGFFLLIKRAVYESIGGLDEVFGPGPFDDDDLARRTRDAGFRLAMAYDLFIHHHGSRTFASAGIDIEALLPENHARFLAKWGEDALRGHKTVSIARWTSGPSPSVHAGAGHVDVALAMIVRNEEANLPDCLESVRGLFPEIVILDTGSSDRTIEIARTFGARTFEVPWVNDFSAARNAALARVTCPMVMYLDADDRLEPSQREALERLFAALKPGQRLAYVMRCACDPDEHGQGRTVVDRVRLFPAEESIRFRYAVHEQILPALREAGVPVQWTDIRVRHTGYANRAVRRAKLARDEAILRDELAARPNDPFVLFNLGSIALEREEWAKALEYHRASLAGSAASDSIVCKLYALIARGHQMLGEPELALEACRAGLEVYPDDGELLFRQAAIRFNAGDFDGAEGGWRRLLALKRPQRFASLDEGIYGHLSRRNLALIAERPGHRDESRQLWADVLTECPGDPDALRALHGQAAP